MPVTSKGQFFTSRPSSRLGQIVMVLALGGAADAQSLTWVSHGPGPNTLGQVENIAGGQVVGAIQAVAPHPTDPSVVYVGAVNGGIWKTSTAMAVNPSWQRQTDSHQSLSIGALEFDPTDASHQTLVAGIGRFSSLGAGGARTGLLRTANGGTSWQAIDGGGSIVGLNISGVAPRGATIVVSANTADSSGRQGIWRSTDTGATWVQVSGGPGTGLATGASYDLASDPSNPARLFTNAGGNGLFRSSDTGATWAKVSNSSIDATLSLAGNVEFAVGMSHNVYVAIVRSGQLAAVFRSPDDGTTWTAMDLPTTREGGIHPGGQGNTHLSIAADPTDPLVVYIGGDRQPDPLPNSIGAGNYTGRLFRGDASQTSGSQFVHLTHSNTLGAPGGGTASSSAPHADSRDMDVAANGVLIEVDDGGIYRRTNPRSAAGDWFSMNGNIQTTEFHAAAWDANADIVVGGAQDTGSLEQVQPSNAQWQSISTADGGVVAVDDRSTPGFSTRYSSFQFLGLFRRRVYDQTNVFQSEVRPALAVLGGGPPLGPQFYTPIELNTVEPTRLIIGGQNSVYESLDQGATVREIGRGIRVNSSGRDPIAYGAFGNPDMLYVGSGSRVFVRTAASPSPLTRSTAYPGTATVAGIAIDPNNPQSAYVVDTTSVFRTADGGASWSNVAGNLATLAPGTLRSIAYSTGSAEGAVLVGADKGVFIARGPSFSNWSLFGTGLPHAPVFHLEYDAADNLVLAATLGRGAWTLEFAPSPIPTGLRQAFVWANEPSDPSYTPQPAYSYNSTGGPITVTRTGTGDYSVRFAGLGGNGSAGGHVQATAFGASNHLARVRWWNSTDSDLVAHIRCVDSSGASIDSRFTVLVTWPPPAGAGPSSGVGSMSDAR